MKALSVLSVAAVLLLWEGAGFLTLTDPIYFPSPLSIFRQSLVLFIDEPGFRVHFFSSLGRLLAGQLWAFPLALVLAFLTTLNSAIRAVISPWISLTYPVPKLALFPFLLILFGTGDLSKIAMIGLGAFFLMYLSFSLGLRRIYESDQFEVVTLYKVSPRKIFWNVFIKGAAPEIINGIKMGFGYGLVMMVGSEMTMSKNGLGFFMWNSWDQFRILDMYACLAWISFLGIVVFRICDWLELKTQLVKNQANQLTDNF